MPTPSEITRKFMYELLGGKHSHYSEIHNDIYTLI